MSSEEKLENEIKDSKCFFCCQSADKTCPHCKLVNYCCDQHLEIHRPENFCFPFRVEFQESVGRFVVASRDIKPTGMSHSKIT
jgi:hypothetical protein